MPNYAHFVHVDGEAGIVDRELVVGPVKDSFQMTYQWLRETERGDHIAHIREDGMWYVGDEGPFTDVMFSPKEPESVLEMKKERR